MLESNLHGRKQKNARYSLRAFANQLDMHPSALSRILAGKQELSLRASLRVIKKLPLTDEEKRRFIASVAEEKYSRALSMLSRAIGTKTDGDPGDAGALLEAALSFSPDRLMVMSLEGRVLLVTPGPMDFMGCTPDEAVGKTMADLFEAETAQRMNAQDQLVMVTGRPSSMEFSIQRETTEHFRRLATPVLGDDGEIEAVLLHLRQITAEKKSRIRADMLQEMTAVLARAIETTDVARAVTCQLLDAAGAHAVCLNVLQGQTLKRIASVPPMRIDTIHLPSVNPHADAFAKRTHLWFDDIRLSPQYAAGVCEETPDLVSCAVLPLIVNDRPIGTIGLGFNAPHAFSEEERTFLMTVGTVCAQALERARLYEVERQGRILAEVDRLKFKMLLDQIPLMAFSVSADGVVDYRNPKSREFFQVNEQETGSSADYWFQFFHPDDREPTRTATEAAMVRGVDYELEFRLRDSQGDYQRFRCRMRPVKDGSDKLVSWLGVCEPLP